MLVYDRSGRCPDHKREPWTKQTRNPVKRIGGRRLQELRDQYFRTNPLCKECEKHGRARRAVIRDHKIPLAEGGTEDPDNIQGLCQDCHDQKTKTEAARGRRRVAG